jgi:hypothetical protein
MERDMECDDIDWKKLLLAYVAEAEECFDLAGTNSFVRLDDMEDVLTFHERRVLAKIMSECGPGSWSRRQPKGN